jgi:hypothetical protein
VKVDPSLSTFAGKHDRQHPRVPELIYVEIDRNSIAGPLRCVWQHLLATTIAGTKVSDFLVPDALDNFFIWNFQYFSKRMKPLPERDGFAGFPQAN